MPGKDLAFLPVGTPEFEAYWSAMTYALRFAEVNRARMLKQAEASFWAFTAMESWEVVMDIHHNYASWETHRGKNGIVHRKGAVRARTGEMVLIPGSMGTASFIAEGLGNPESFETCQHGAGRAMSRTAARSRKTSDEVYAEMKKIGVELLCSSPRDVAEEAAFRVQGHRCGDGGFGRPDPPDDPVDAARCSQGLTNQPVRNRRLIFLRVAPPAAVGGLERPEGQITAASKAATTRASRLVSHAAPAINSAFHSCCSTRRSERPTRTVPPLQETVTDAIRTPSRGSHVTALADPVLAASRTPCGGSGTLPSRIAFEAITESFASEMIMKGDRLVATSIVAALPATVAALSPASSRDAASSASWNCGSFPPARSACWVSM